MQPHQDIVTEVLESPDGPSTGAFFDFDGTLISGYSAIAFIQEQMKRGYLSPRELILCDDDWRLSVPARYS
jgi:putative phosphoserine phosphatase/1-acylglycerol-3-phosphate O-acyltransferase